jgi:hypothetical protein
MARHHSDLVREAVIVPAERGFAADIDLGGNHIKGSWFQDGRKRLLIASRSPSDRRAALGSRTMLRRLLAEGAA